MPHVDEGTLHAYLDGELPSAERDAVDAHLAQCAACRTRLTEERALLERASALLGAARPFERPAPPLEQLRRVPSPRRSPWRVRRSFAWAASIALALGLGYTLRGGGPDNAAYRLGYRTGPQADGLAENRAPAAAQADHPVERSAPARRFQQRERAAPPTDVAAATEKSRADSLAAHAAEAGAAAGVLALKASPQLRNATPEPATRQREADSLAARQRADALVLDEAVVTAAPQTAGVRGRATTTQWPIISRGTARTLLGTDPVGLPGLARKIRRSPSPDATVVVEQQIDSATTIQIFQHATATGYVDSSMRFYRSQERAEREIAPADRLARYVGRLRVEIAGPLSVDSLNRLLNQVQPLP